jgi:hypothetical protein
VSSHGCHSRAPATINALWEAYKAKRTDAASSAQDGGRRATAPRARVRRLAIAFREVGRRA